MPNTRIIILVLLWARELSVRAGPPATAAPWRPFSTIFHILLATRAPLSHRLPQPAAGRAALSAGHGRLRRTPPAERRGCLPVPPAARQGGLRGPAPGEPAAQATRPAGCRDWRGAERPGPDGARRRLMDTVLRRPPRQRKAGRSCCRR